jgi:hypothetical protein
MRHRYSALRRVRRSAGLAVIAACIAAPALYAQGGLGSTSDPRVGLKAGFNDAAEASSNMKLISHSPKAPDFSQGPLGGLTYANSDMAFRGNVLVQGNFSGFQIWDISNPQSPSLRKTVVCATDQGDPSIVGNLLFISAESTRGRLDCGTEGVKDTVSADRMRGVRIFDISDLDNPRQVADVQTCRGSHTHTVVPDPKDPGVVYIYVSGTAGVRSPNELAGCSSGTVAQNPNTAQFRLEVIRVPLAHPEQARIVSSPRVFGDLTRAESHGNPVGDTAAARRRPRAPRAPATAADSARMAAAMAMRSLGPNQCHDITVYPAIGLAGGACAGAGLLLDIHDPAHPTRLQAVVDSNFSFWHSATFSNDGSKLLFTDEWGGGTQPKCRSIDPLDWGGDAIFTLSHNRLTQHGYFKMPAVQTSEENCVAHNGSLVPVPGRDILVQGWYQGGVDVFDFTNPDHPQEIAYFDRGPIDSTKMVIGGFWAGYWYNGLIYGSEIARGLDVFDLTPSPMLSQNEIDAAKLVHMDTFNPQSQPKIVWPAAFPVVRSYLDQIVRWNGLSAARTTSLARSIDAAEKLSGARQRAALNKVAATLDGYVSSAKDAKRVKLMAAAVRDLARAAR